MCTHLFVARDDPTHHADRQTCLDTGCGCICHSITLTHPAFSALQRVSEQGMGRQDHTDAHRCSKWGLPMHMDQAVRGRFGRYNFLPF